MSVEKLMEFHDESLRDGPCHHRRVTPQSSACASLHAPTMTISEIRALDDSAMIPMTSGTPEAKPRTNASNPTGQPMLMSRPSGHTPVAESMRRSEERRVGKEGRSRRDGGGYRENQQTGG